MYSRHSLSLLDPFADDARILMYVGLPVRPSPLRRSTWFQYSLFGFISDGAFTLPLNAREIVGVVSVSTCRRPSGFDDVSPLVATRCYDHIIEKRI